MISASSQILPQTSCGSCSPPNGGARPSASTSPFLSQKSWHSLRPLDNNALALTSPGQFALFSPPPPSTYPGTCRCTLSDMTLLKSIPYKAGVSTPPLQLDSVGRESPKARSHAAAGRGTALHRAALGNIARSCTALDRNHICTDINALVARQVSTL